MIGSLSNSKSHGAKTTTFNFPGKAAIARIASARLRVALLYSLALKSTSSCRPELRIGTFRAWLLSRDRSEFKMVEAARRFRAQEGRLFVL